MKNKIFPFIIALSALLISGSAAFYSIFGLGKMFAGASTEVMILAASLEFAKLVAASFLYQYWRDINKALKSYLLAAIFILMIITSAGIYGFLSSAYQDTAFKVENQAKNIEVIDNQISSIKKDIILYQNQIEQGNKRIWQLTELRLNLQATQDTIIRRGWSTKNIRGQIKEIESEIKKLDSISGVLNDSIASKNSRIYAMEKQKIELQNNHNIAREIGPLKYISKLTGKPMDMVVNWYIFLLIFVFDPLAISLVISANFAFKKIQNNPVEFIKKEENLSPASDQYPVSDIRPGSQISAEGGKSDKGFKIKSFDQDAEDQKINLIGLIQKTNSNGEKIQKEENIKGMAEKDPNIMEKESPKRISKEETDKYINKNSFIGYKINRETREENPLNLR